MLKGDFKVGTVEIALADLVNAGFLGFAVCIMVFSYRLLSELVTSEKLGTPSLVKAKTRAVNSFLLLSCLVLILGIGYTLIPREPESLTISVEVIGNGHEDEMKALRFRSNVGEDVFLDEKLAGRLTVRSDDRVTIFLAPLTAKLEQYAKTIADTSTEVDRKRQTILQLERHIGDLRTRVEALEAEREGLFGQILSTISGDEGGI